MTCEQAQRIIASGWLNETTSAEMPDLRRHLETCAECSAGTIEFGRMWEQLAAIPAPEPSQALHLRWRDTLRSFETPPPEPAVRTSWFANLRPRNPGPRNPRWQTAFAAACVAVGVFIGASIPRQNPEIARLQEEIAGTREMVALSLLQQQSATERIRGVNYADRFHAMDPEVLSALTGAVAHDPSVNVRLAAIDALSKASGNEAVLTTLTQSLLRQDSPLVQAALIDYLIDARDSQATGALRQLAAQPDVNPAVLDRARFALAQLK